MGIGIWLEGYLHAKDPKDPKWIIDNGTVQYEGWISWGTSSTTITVAETLEKLGMDPTEFLKLFRLYWLRNDVFKKLSDEERKRRIREGEEEFIWELKDIKKMKEICEQAIRKIEDNINLEEISEKIKKIPHFGKIQDYIEEFEYKCRDSWGSLKPLLAICNRALELKVRLRVS